MKINLKTLDLIFWLLYTPILIVILTEVDSNWSLFPFVKILLLVISIIYFAFSGRALYSRKISRGDDNSILKLHDDPATSLRLNLMRIEIQNLATERKMTDKDLDFMVSLHFENRLINDLDERELLILKKLVKNKIFN